MARTIKLPLHLRTFVREEGPDDVSRTVFCPRRGRSTEISHCSACERMQGIAWDPEAGGFIECQPGTPQKEAEELRRPHGPPRADFAESAARCAMSEVMRPIAVCVPPETTVRRLRDVFAERNVDVAVVVDAERDLLGTVSRLDLVDAAPDTRTDAVMSSKLHPVAETAPISHAIAIMAAEKVSVVPVVTEDGEVVGLWDANGALRWTAERMGYVMDGVEDSGASED